MDATVAVACIGLVGAVIVALIERSRRENERDHAIVADGIVRIEGKLDNHISDHVRASFKA
tara:strand:- start:239 stop:421 length:183 start_codon:yes stop_codon:yes gene_type:complete